MNKWHLFYAQPAACFFCFGTSFAKTASQLKQVMITMSFCVSVAKTIIERIIIHWPLRSNLYFFIF